MGGGPTYGKNPPTNTIDFGIITGQHWRSWSEIQEQWLWAEESGWDSCWAFDHFFSLREGEMGECLEGWALLGALAQMTKRVQLGLMVAGMTHRYPAVLFKNAVTIDHISGGRHIFGVGAAWNDREHEAYGIPFPSPKIRVDRFAEAMEMYRLLETQERTTFNGENYQLVDAPFEPKPVFGHMPILIGSTGKRMLRYVAKYADQWDGGEDPDGFKALGERLNQHCREIGRDPSEIRWVLSTGRDKVASEDAFRRHVIDYGRVGVRSFLMNIPTGSPSPTLRRIANEVIPELREQFEAGDLF
jgi:alkanesulfonate monooxygenase SsuD/methylene tetrahydromethanopterin reductase-like flavin-dependent oxidoreductase (luciferase family)